MNFLNEHLKTLKNVLAEGLEQKVDFDGSSLEVTGSEERSDINSDSDNLRKLCQHQSQEVNFQCFYIIALFLVSCSAHDSQFPF